MNVGAVDADEHKDLMSRYEVQVGRRSLLPTLPLTDHACEASSPAPGGCGQHDALAQLRHSWQQPTTVERSPRLLSAAHDS